MCEIGDAAKVSRDGTNNQSCQKGCRGYMTYQTELLSLGHVDVDHSVYL